LVEPVLGANALTSLSVLLSLNHFFFFTTTMYSTVYRRNKNRKKHFIFRATKLSVLGGKKITGEILFFLAFLVGENLNIYFIKKIKNYTFYMILF
jgi:hypothetical protein